MASCEFPTRQCSWLYPQDRLYCGTFAKQNYYSTCGQSPQKTLFWRAFGSQTGCIMTFSVELLVDTRLARRVSRRRPPKSPHYALARWPKVPKGHKVAVGAVSFARFLRVFRTKHKNAQKCFRAPKARFCPLPMRVQKRPQKQGFSLILGVFWDPPM